MAKISLSGAITFINELYNGSTSDAEIVKRYGILNKELWSKDDDTEAGRGFKEKKSLILCLLLSTFPPY